MSYTGKIKYLQRCNKFVKRYCIEPRSIPVEFIDGYEDPHSVFNKGKIRNGFSGMSNRKIIVGKLFLLGKVF
jgi:hypothetical protein